MNVKPKPQSWFDALRRDGALFAFIGALMLVLNMLQPLAAAGMELDGRWVICTNGVAPGGGDNAPVGDTCPVCISGHSCAAPAPLQKAIAATSVDFAAPTPILLTSRLPADAAQAPDRRDGRNPAIRAPPFPA